MIDWHVVYRIQIAITRALISDIYTNIDLKCIVLFCSELFQVSGLADQIRSWRFVRTVS